MPKNRKIDINQRIILVKQIQNERNCIRDGFF